MSTYVRDGNAEPHMNILTAYKYKTFRDIEYIYKKKRLDGTKREKEERERKRGKASAATEASEGVTA